MSTTQWTKLQLIFHEALEQAPEDRTGFLKLACKGDEELRAEIDALVRAAETEDTFLQGSPADLLEGVNQQDGHVRGRMIGSYELVRVLGIGGMGAVYEAIQHQPKRTVALKVLRGGLVSQEMRRRFGHESQILARLQHPGIAQIYEAGTHTDQGEFASYFAMEFVEGGQTILEFAKSHNLDMRQRLELFVGVCDAVHHGHQFGVIHRDLKPGNILVTPSGQPKVIDFGVARIVAPDATLNSLQTQTGQLVGTLRYMSPEQCSSESNVGVQSDVYSLGVVLFELLSEEFPYDFPSTSIPSVVKTIVDSPPRRLSSIDRECRGDLDTIAAKALEKDLARRYESALDLAADIRSLLRDEPIAAKPASVIYQFQKFARRNKRLVAAIFVALALLLSGLTVSTALYIRAETARSEAEFREYVATLAAAGASIRAYDVADARRRLVGVPEHLRGWEWRHLVQRLDRSRHTITPGADGVRCLAIHPDGNTLALGGRDHNIHLWNLKTDELINKLVGHGGVIDALSFNPDGSILASGSTDLIKLWDMSNGELLADLNGHTGHIHGVAFSPDGRMLASASQDHTVILWDVKTGEELHTLRGHTNRVLEVVFMPDGKSVVSCSWDGDIRFWEIVSGETTRVIVAHDGIINEIAISPDAETLLSTSEDGTLKLWDVQTGRNLRTFYGHTGGVRAVAFTIDGKQAISSSKDLTVRVWDVQTAKQLTVLTGHDGIINDVLCLSDPLRIVSASLNDDVKIWDFEAEDIRALRGHRGWVYDIAVSPDGQLVASAGGGRYPAEDMSVRLWEIDETRQFAQPIKHDELVWAVAFNSDGTVLASCSADHTVKLWERSSNSIIASLPHDDEVVDVVFHPTNPILATACFDGAVRLWDAQSMQIRNTLIGHEDRVWCIDFSSKGDLIASGSADETIRLWNSDTGRHIATLAQHGATVTSLIFTEDDSTLIAGTANGDLVLWDVAAQQRVMTQRIHNEAIYALALSPDGTRLATGSHDYKIKILETARWQELLTLHGHTHYVWSLAFTPDGDHLISGSADLTIRIWDTEAVSWSEPRR